MQGGDWGGFVASVMGHQYPERLTGIHINLLAVRRDPAMLANPTPEEKMYLGELNHFLKEEMGYQWIQGTRPQTLAFGLTDSPAGPRGVDPGEVPRLDRLQRRSRQRRQPRRDAGQHLALLVHRRDRLVVLALLRAHARALADRRGPNRRRADGLRRVSQGDPAPAALGGREDLHRHPALERDAARADTSRRWSSPRRWRARCASSSRAWGNLVIPALVCPGVADGHPRMAAHAYRWIPGTRPGMDSTASAAPRAP